MTKAVAILAILFLLYLLSTKGRKGHPELQRLRGWNYAHRGLHGCGVPENSMAAFRKARDAGYGIELDVHLLADGELGVIHDSLLKRTTGKEGRVEDLSVSELKQYRLEETEETIPEFGQVLEMFDGRAPLIIELKAVGNNHARLCEQVCLTLDRYKGPYCLESFDPRCLYWLRKHRPDVIRGQLSENYFKTGGKLPGILKFMLTHQMLNFITKPDFVAYRFGDRVTFSNFLIGKLWKIERVTWTLQNKQEHDAAVSEGWIPIFENYLP